MKFFPKMVKFLRRLFHLDVPCNRDIAAGLSVDSEIERLKTSVTQIMTSSQRTAAPEFIGSTGVIKVGVDISLVSTDPEWSAILADVPLLLVDSKSPVQHTEGAVLINQVFTPRTVAIDACSP